MKTCCLKEEEEPRVLRVLNHLSCVENQNQTSCEPISFDEGTEMRKSCLKGREVSAFEGGE
jgi:hypothetical protein